MRTEDGYIISKCLNGDPTAFGFLVDKYKAGVYASAYNRLQDFHDAEDVTQEAFLKAYRSLRTLRRWDSFASWLYRITFNLCKDWLRAKSRRPDGEFIEDQNQEILEAPSRKTYDQELVCQSVRETLNSLPEMYRQVLTLYYFGGMTSTEIARFVGVSSGAIRMRLGKARLLLKEEVLAMMNTTFEKQKLQATFTFRIMEAVKRIKIQSAPRMTDIPLGLSLATGIMFAVLSLNPNMSILGHTKIPMWPQLPVESKMLATGAIPVDILTPSQRSIRSSRRGDRNPVIMTNAIRQNRASEDANLRLEQVGMVIQHTIDRTENMIRQQQLLLDGLKVQLEEIRQLRGGTMGMDTRIRLSEYIDFPLTEPPSFDPAFPFTDRLEVNVELPSETGEKLLQGGDFTGGFNGWEVKYATDLLESDRTHEIVYDDDMGSDVIEFRRTNGGATGSIIGLYQDVYIDLSKYADVRLKLDVKPVYHNLTGGGWAGGVEYPVTLQIVFIDQRGEPHVWSHGFYYRDVSRYDDATKVDENAWFSYTSPDLLDARPDCSDEARVKDRLGWKQPVHKYVEPVVPTHITRVLIMGGGWDYTGRADNIELITTPVLFNVMSEAQKDLNNEDISEALRQEFEDYNISLSDDAAVSVKETDAEWSITDGGKTYSVKRQGDTLKIYINP